MQWENLTAPDFAEAVRETGVCILGMGVLEKHSTHLPVGQDFLAVHKIVRLAAEKEPAVVFPPWYFGQIYEAMAYQNIRLNVTDLLLAHRIRKNHYRQVKQLTPAFSAVS